LDGSAVLAALVAGITVAAVLGKGAFHAGGALAVAVLAAAVVVAALARGVGRGAVRVTVATGALAAWWLASAALHSRPHAFLPLGASVLGFLAAFLAMRALPPGLRSVGAGVAVGIGAVSAVIGLFAEGLRAFPLAARAQDLWRVSTTLTYSNAAGLLLGMTLLLGLGLDQRRRPVRLAVCLCAAALVATQSRGAVLATALALLLVPAAQMRSSLWTLVLGVLAGLAVVAMSTGDSARPLVIVVVAVAAGAAVILPPGGHRRHLDLRRLLRPPGLVATLVAVTLVVVTLVVAGSALRRPIERRLNEDRLPEWSAATAQWRSSPLLGVGPDKRLVLDAATETTTAFAQSEYLQVLAGGGLLGAALLVASGVAVAADIRRRDVLTSCGTAALVAFALGGAVDFVWHLPALGLLGGWAAGIAARAPPVEPPVEE